jgi:hypothetical protein
MSLSHYSVLAMKTNEYSLKKDGQVIFRVGPNGQTEEWSTVDYTCTATTGTTALGNNPFTTTLNLVLHVRRIGNLREVIVDPIDLTTIGSGAGFLYLTIPVASEDVPSAMCDTVVLTRIFLDAPTELSGSTHGHEVGGAAVLTLSRLKVSQTAAGPADNKLLFELNPINYDVSTAPAPVYGEFLVDAWHDGLANSGWDKLSFQYHAMGSLFPSTI